MYSSFSLVMKLTSLFRLTSCSCQLFSVWLIISSQRVTRPVVAIFSQHREWLLGAINFMIFFTTPGNICWFKGCCSVSWFIPTSTDASISFTLLDPGSERWHPKFTKLQLAWPSSNSVNSLQYQTYIFKENLRDVGRRLDRLFLYSAQSC